MADRASDNQLWFLVAQVELGLTFARLAATATDAWLAAHERAQAVKAYDTVLRHKGLIAMTQVAHIDLTRRLEELRQAIQRTSTR